MLPRRPPPIAAATPVRVRPSIPLFPTWNGFFYFLMMIFMGLAAMNLQANLLFGVFGLMIGVWLISGAIRGAVLRRLRVRRILPEHAVVGDPVTLVYEITNGKRFWPSLSVMLSEIDAAEAFTRQPLAYMLHAAARTTATVLTEVIPKRRGLHVFDRFQLSTSFPFGFRIRTSQARQHETIVVFPAIGQVDRKLLQLCRPADRSGATMRPRRGGDDEFYGVKEFRAGENPKSIYWRRSARTGVLVSKEMTQVSPPKILILVDTFLKSRSAAEHAAVEKTIAMAASLASHALASGLMVGLYTWNGDWLGIHPNRGKRHRVDVLAHLAQLSLNTTQDAQALLKSSQEFLPSGVTPILLTPRALPTNTIDPNRSNVVVVAADSQRWITFEPAVDFSKSMPWNQQPGEEKREARSEKREFQHRNKSGMEPNANGKNI